LHCNYYKTHMFNIQKFINVFEAGYFIFDIAFTYIANNGKKLDNL